jgi:hypothetical protein
MRLDYLGLEELVTKRRLERARPLTVSQLRVAMVPQNIAPGPIGEIDPSWLLPRFPQSSGEMTPAQDPASGIGNTR